MATGLLHVLRLPIPGVNVAARLLHVMRLPIPGVGRGTMLRRVESLTMRLGGTRTIMPGRLGAQRAQSHKQAHCENNAPPSFWFHFTYPPLINFAFRLFQISGPPG
jgi:hypothetical protein